MAKIKGKRTGKRRAIKRSARIKKIRNMPRASRVIKPKAKAKSKPKTKPGANPKRSAKLRMLMVVPSARYFEWNASMVRLMTDAGRNGVYVSFHRPFKNIMKVLKHYGVNTNRLLFVDVATGVTGAKKEPHTKCIHIAKANIGEIDRAVHKSLKKLSGKKFIFVDSLTMASFYKPKKETRRLAKLLIEKIDNEHANYVIFSVAEELAELEFVKDLKKDIDEIIKMP